MDIPVWKERLSQLGLGEIHIYREVGSTNLVAQELVNEEVPPFSLVVADSQTAGKGRQGRTWITQPGQALAFSWILYPEKGRIQPEILGRLSGLGALAVLEAVQEVSGLESEIKWPNDLLIDGKKYAGILVEAHWQECQLLDVILGIGINVGIGSIPSKPDFIFPATSLEAACGKEINRLELLVKVLESLLKWYNRLGEPSLVNAWNVHLAYKDQLVSLISPQGSLAEGRVSGIGEDGSLLLETDLGVKRQYQSGEIQIRLVDRT